MNKRKKTILGIPTAVILVAGILFSSCTKNDQPAPLTSYNMSAYANGEFVTFNATITNYGDSNIAIWSTWVTNINETYDLNISYVEVNKGFIGNYTFGSSAGYVQYQAYPTYSVSNGYLFQYEAHSGSFSITAYDSINKTISGTFNCVGVGGAGNNVSQNSSYPSTIDITNGVFTKVPL
jgi:hypothetical protein